MKGPCSHCGATSTPCWRRSPIDGLPLCNACGARLIAKGTLEGYFPKAASKKRRLLAASNLLATGQPLKLHAAAAVAAAAKREVAAPAGEGDALSTDSAASAASSFAKDRSEERSTLESVQLALIQVNAAAMAEASAPVAILRRPRKQSHPRASL